MLAAPPQSKQTTHTPAQEGANPPAPPAAVSALAPETTTAIPHAAALPKTGASEAAYAATNRKPPYPRLARLNGEQGTVQLRVLVRADGTAGPVEIASSSGYPLLDQSAAATVRTWRFSPATVDGRPVDEWYRITIPFTLLDD